MGRLLAPQKPLGSSRDPAEAARVAGIKQAVSSKDSGNSDPPSAPPMSADLVKRLDKLSKDDLRSALFNILERHADARTTFLHFCDMPVGGAARPYDFSPFYSRCVDALDQVGPVEEYDSDDGGHNMSASQAQDEIIAVYSDLEDVCSKPPFSGTAKLEGMQTLLDIVILLDGNEDLEDEDSSSEDRCLDLREGAFSAMEAICKTVAVGERQELYNTSAFKNFLEDCRNYGEQSASAIEQEVEDQLADFSEEEEDDDEDDSEDDLDENGFSKEEDALFREKYGEDYREYM
jgi:hypothetical protein